MANKEGLKDDIIQEAEYIFPRLIKLSRNVQDKYIHEDQIKEKIQGVLKFMRKEYLDVPMIAKYRSYDYS